MTLQPGALLLHYRLCEKLGEGGMGEVWKATDTTLGREVAIKILPAEFALDADRLGRFEREAKVLASLNNPGIAAIYGFHDAGGLRFLAMELVPGEDLAARLKRGALSLDIALDIARQIAEALEAAHEQGVIHRDLKPANVQLTQEGRVKVLDFGLAKAIETAAASSSGNPAMSPTITSLGTVAGVILGTAAYMSPEQARGKPVDRRADIWSFGCVLFECLAGRRLFEGETVSDTIAKILEREPDWTLLPPSTPPKVGALLRRCLEKDAKKRQRDIGDVRIELEEAVAARASSSRPAAVVTAPAAIATRSPRTLAWSALLLVLGAAAGIALWSLFGLGARNSAGTAEAPVRLSFAVPLTLNASGVGLTRDGRSLIVSGRRKLPDGTEEPRAQLYLRGLNDYELKPIPGTDGVRDVVKSPDGKWLALVQQVSEQSSQRRILKVPVDGSAPPVTLSDWDDNWIQLGAWLENGDLLITSDAATRFFRMPSGGGAPKPAQKIDTGPTISFPTIVNTLPRDAGAFFAMDSWGPKGYQQDIWLLNLATGSASRLLENAGSAAYAPTGHVVFTRGDALMAAPFDLAHLAITGEVGALLSGVRTGSTGDSGSFGLGANGTLVYPPGGRLGADRQLVVAEASGAVTPFTSERRAFTNVPAASRDGRRVAVVMANPKGTFETWVAEQGRTDLRRVIALPNADCASAVWSPDGLRLAYSRTARDENDGIYVQRADGANAPQLLLKSVLQEFNTATSWTPDGTDVVVTRYAGAKRTLLVVPLSTGGVAGTPKPIHATSGSEDGLRYSPDGRLAAFHSDTSGKTQTLVALCDANGAFGPPVVVPNSVDGSFAWSGDSRRLVYFVPPKALMSVVVETKPTISLSTPVPAYDLKKLRVDPNQWDLRPDGSLIAIQKGVGEDDITEYSVVLNWFDELKAKMGTNK